MIHWNKLKEKNMRFIKQRVLQYFRLEFIVALNNNFLVYQFNAKIAILLYFVDSTVLYSFYVFCFLIQFNCHKYNVESFSDKINWTNFERSLKSVSTITFLWANSFDNHDNMIVQKLTWLWLCIFELTLII